MLFLAREDHSIVQICIAAMELLKQASVLQWNCSTDLTNSKKSEEIFIDFALMLMDAPLQAFYN